MCKKNTSCPLPTAAAIEFTTTKIEALSIAVHNNKKPTRKSCAAIDAQRAAIELLIEGYRQADLLNAAEVKCLRACLVHASRGYSVEPRICDGCHGIKPLDMTKCIGDAIDLCDRCVADLDNRPAEVL